MQYFTGKRASSYDKVVDPTLPGGYIENEYRQCAHCGYHWLYKPGSGKKRGICLQCGGLTCGKMECEIKCEPLEQKFDRQEKQVK